MKVKSKLFAALDAFMDHAIRKSSTAEHTIITNIEATIVRCTSHHDAPIDDKYVHEILFLVSNAPGSISFLANRISSRFESTRDPVVALKSLLLLHRLLRGGDRYFEQDLRSQDLRIDLSWCSGRPNGLHSFLLSYSSFLRERMVWIINQAGNLEPSRPPRKELLSYEEDAIESVIFRLSKCQSLLDRVMDCLPADVLSNGRVIQSAVNIILRESFRVYESFQEMIEDLAISSFDLKKSLRVSAHEILKKARAQTIRLHEFYQNCKRSIFGKGLDYPCVRIIAPAQISSIDQFLPSYCYERMAIPEDEKKKNETQTTSEESPTESNEPVGALFSQKLETTISTVWVEFDEEDVQTLSFSLASSSTDSSSTAHAMQTL